MRRNKNGQNNKKEQTSSQWCHRLLKSYVNKKITDLHVFLASNIECFENHETGGCYFDLPEMELYPDDYLMFASNNFERYHSLNSESEKTNELISCVSNLKRALDSQIECFLHVYSIRQSVRRLNLSSNQKLSFIANVGIFSSRTINRFIELRNKVEHEFRKPFVKDIEALYDLVIAAVSLLKNAISKRSLIDYAADIGLDEERIIGRFSAKYSDDPVAVEISYKIFEKPVNKEDDWNELNSEKRKIMFKTLKEINLVATLDDQEAFPYYLRCLFVLHSLDSYGTYEHVKERIKPYSEPVRIGNG